MKNIILFLALCIGAFAQGATTNPAPATVFTVQQGAPFNVSLMLGAGTQPLTYQWTKDGVVIPAPRGTASNLSFTSAQTADAGVYVCTVTNSAGATVSNAGNVFVSVPLPIVLPPNTATLIIGPGASAPPGSAK